MTDTAIKRTSINVDEATRRRAKHISVVTGEPVYAVTATAITRLLESYGLADPPTAQKVE